MQNNENQTPLSPGTEQVISQFLSHVELPTVIKSLTYIFNQFLTTHEAKEGTDLSDYSYDHHQVLDLLYGLQRTQEAYLITKEGITKTLNTY